MTKENQSNQAIYDARTLGVPKMLILGIQHVFAMFGATVLVPLITGLSVSTTLLMAGLGTLLFHFITGRKVPAFLGSSFAFLGGFQAIANLDSGKYAAMEASEKLQYACGGIVVAGLLYVVLALLMAEGARIRPMEMMMGPVTTGGKNRITLFTPKRWMSPATATYTRPAATTPPQA